MTMRQAGLRWKLDDAVAVALAVVGTLGVFALDLLTPLGYVVWIGYGLPLWAVSRLPTKTTALLLATALASTGLIVAGWILSPPGIDPVMGLMNRTIGVCSLWVMTGVLLRERAIDEQLRAALERLQQSEERLRQSSERLTLAQQSARVGAFEWNIQTNVNIWTPELEALYGLPAGGFGGHVEDWISRLHPDDRAATVAANKRAVEESGEFQSEFRVVWPDGTTHWLAGRAKVICDESGRPLRLIGINIDIDERKQIEESLRRSERELSDFFEHASIGLHRVGPDGIILQVNQTELDLLGYSREEYVGHHIAEFHVDRPIIQDILSRLTCGETLRQYPAKLRCKDGSIRNVRINSNVLFEDGTFIHTRCFTLDVTDRARAEEALVERDQELTAANDALRKQTAALAESNKELEGFSYSVSHDLRAPLRTIDAFSRIVEEDHGPQLNAEAQRCLTVVRKAAAQAGELIDDLLEFSRLGRQAMGVRSVKMGDLAREVTDELKILREGRRIDVIISDLPSCQGDRRLLKLVWTNLITNAIKYTKHRDEARVEIGWMPDDASAEAVTYYVKDDGVGFDMKYVHKLYNVFQRLHRKEDFEGTGVGLAIVHRIVFRHGGRVWAEGKVDGGATFFFSLRKAAA